MESFLRLLGHRSWNLLGVRRSEFGNYEQRINNKIRVGNDLLVLLHFSLNIK